MKPRDKDETQSPPPEKVFYDNRIKRKNVLALNEKVAAIREYEKMPVYKRVGRMFHCSPDQIKRIVQQKESILKAWEQRTRRCQDAKTLEMKVVRVSMLGKAVYDWIRRMMYYMDFKITDGLIQKMALQFKSAMGLQNFFPHQDWCDKFRQTYNINEIDSKLLKIGYTQGYSVQIKDVMKDVLSECTPDASNKGADGDSDANPESVVDTDIEGTNASGPTPPAGAGDAAAQVDTTNNNANDKKETERDQIKERADPKPPELSSNNLKTPQASTSKASSSNDTQSPRRMPKLQPIRQLVALPLQGGAAGMPQKVLVATPITSVGSLAMNNLTPPMTMTIIPLATIAQPKSAQSAGEKQATVPPPMVEIKKEIKQEPPDEEVQIKQECVSDDDDCIAMESEPEPQPVSVSDSESEHDQQQDNQRGSKLPPKKAKLSADVADETDTDNDNIALSSLRKLIKNKDGRRVVPLAPPGLPPRQDLPRLAPNPRDRLPVARPLARTPPLPPLIKAPTVAAALSSSPTFSAPMLSTPTSGGGGGLGPGVAAAAAAAEAGSACRRANRRSPNIDSPFLPPIKSCSEARQYLKMLEEFALYKENFRLIGLITRADEVLRELDGDDDIDVD